MALNFRVCTKQLFLQAGVAKWQTLHRPSPADSAGEASVKKVVRIMLRYAFKMQVKPGFAKEYKKRHDAIWPELAQELRDAGVADYSIFLDEETLTLFAVQKLDENNKADQLPKTEIVQKWWAYMADIMETHPDDSPVAKPLKEVFHQD